MSSKLDIYVNLARKSKGSYDAGVGSPRIFHESHSDEPMEDSLYILATDSKPGQV
jgi:hypothetical protein